MGVPATDPCAPVQELDANATGPNPVVRDRPTGRMKAARASLLCVSGEDLGRTAHVDGEALDIGRAATGLSLTASNISRRHARIRRGPGGYVVEDLGSANGTFVNGAQIDAATPLRIGDRIQLGNTILVFSLQDELEERTERLQRLDALGTLAGGIAHDFNNALAVIIANLTFIEDALPEHDANARESLDAIRGAAQSATNLARRLVRLGSKDPLTIGTVKLAPLVEQSLKVAARRAKVQPEVVLDLEPDLAILGSFDELQHALMNLYFNACDAMPAGGTFRVATRAVRIEREGAVSHQLDAPGDYVELLVADTGSGMDEATRARLFEPFFTTKVRGKGNGLGLAMVHGTVRRHGGSIEVSSRPGKGTTFRILLHRARS